ncbi:MAG: patatin-like phospholipase family protein, partial [Ectothiorhodospiraceae bacterium]|nr:patatin-like phospholipase family protein [Ectothiorhodospiraceae bacterium]
MSQTICSTSNKITEEPQDRGDYGVLRRLVDSEENRLVVSFGGGAVAGLCGNIALAALIEELGLRESVDEIWGTSAGAIVGGCWATGTPASYLLETITQVSPRAAIDVSYAALLTALLLRPFGRPLPDGLIRGRRLAETVDKGLRIKDFENCPTPFRCIACSDDGLNRRKIFRRGPLLPAILSSMTLPGILMPRPRLELEDCGYLDGALLEKTPLISPIAEHLRSGDARKLLLLATHFGGDERRTPACGFVQRFIQTIYAVEDVLWDYQLKEARHRYREVVSLVLLNPHIVEPSLFDLSR